MDTDANQGSDTPTPAPAPAMPAAADRDRLFDFPCRFPVKAMGLAAPDFAELIVEIVARHAPDLDRDSLAVRPSRGGRWQSVTLVIEARGRDQLDAIYRDLGDHDRVIWAL